MEISKYISAICNCTNSQILNNIPKDIQDHIKIRKIKKGTYVTEKSANISHIYIFCKGHMQVKNEFANGMVDVFAAIEPIAYIGAIELLGGSTVYSAFLQAKTDCEILELPNEYFFKWLSCDKQFMYEVLKFVSKLMLDQSTNSREALIYPAIFLVTRYLVESYKNDGNEIMYLEKSTSEIGAFFCVSVRTIQRVLKQLRESGLVYIKRNVIMVNSSQYNKLIQKLDEMESKL